ncbi:MAG: tetratricopeptide repeat protein [Balneolaceae bacterium]
MALSNKAKNYIRKHHSKKSTSQLADTLKQDKDEIQAFMNELKEPLPLKKKALFYSITLSIPILFFVVLELILQSVNYKGDTRLFLDPEIPTEEYYFPNPKFASRYFFYTKTTPSPSIDVFLQQKPENSYRIFAMGGSSAAGYPYGFNGTFSRVVDDILTDAMPDKEVEVVNVATSAISTYTLVDQVDEILEQQPDAIMIYTGHNEFYGALGVGSNETLGGFPGFVRFYLKLQRFKTFLLLREMIVNSGQWFAGVIGNEENINARGTLMERIIRDQSIELDGTMYKMAMVQFQSNMEAIIQKFEKHRVPVYLSTISSNIKDQPPFVSIESDHFPAADSIYYDAQSLFQKNDTITAKEQFEFAKDLDGLKFRAPTEINDIIHSLSNEFENVRLVPTHRKLEDASPAGIIGNNLMLEHLHPNQTGYFIMGKTFAESLINDLKQSNMVSNPDLHLDTYFQKMYLTDYDDLIVHHRIRALKQGFPFVTEGEITPYQKGYKPTDIVDSLAFEVVQKDKRWDAAKIEVAEYYQSQMNIEKALLEYYGLIRNQPWNDAPYIFSARLLLDHNKFSEAEPLLRKAYELKPDEAYTTKMLGAIELHKGNTKEAIRLLEESRQVNPNDPQMLYNLSGAYGTNQEFEKALEIAEEVIEVNPNFPGVNEWKQQLNRIINSNRN